jgi:signal peptidase
VRGAVVKALRFLVAILGAVALVAWFLLLRPSFLGGPATYVMVGGESMEPTLSSGDLALVRREGNFGSGDIVAFRVPEGEPGEGAIVIHRIVGGSAAEGFVMQGDNNDSRDPWRIQRADILGTTWLHLPGAGRWLAVLRAPAVMAAVAAGVAVFLVLGGGEKKPHGQLSPASPDAPAASRRPRGGRFRSPAVPLSLFLIMLLAKVATIAFGARH